MHFKIHADEFESSGGAALAVEIGATSADHLGAIATADIPRIAASNVVATLLPATLFNLGLQRYAPARALIESGAAVALATDFNPGTSPTLNMQFVLTLACTQMKMTPAEAITAATINGACAVRRQDRMGSIETGKQADLSVYDVMDYREIPYFAAVNFCAATFKRGKQVWRAHESIGRVRPQFQRGPPARSRGCDRKCHHLGQRRVPAWARDGCRPQPCGGNDRRNTGSIGEAAVRGAGEAVKLIDLTTHQGEHPRMGAVDVIPFIPIRGVTIEQCLPIATQTAQEIAEPLSRSDLPVRTCRQAA